MYATLHLTLGCNLRCAYCYAGDKVDRSMTPETALEALDFLVRTARGKDDFLNISFFGGEPLLKFDLIRLVVGKAGEYRAAGANIGFHVVTNGTLLTDEVIDYFRGNGIFYTLSLDGDRTSQDMERRAADGRGTFDRIMERVPKILAADPYVRVNMVATPRTAFNLAASVKFLHGLGFRYLEAQPDFGAPWDGRGLRILRGQYREIADYYVDRHREGRKLYIDLIDDKIRARALRKVRRPGTASPCAAGDATLAVAPSGTIYPCVQFVKDDGPAEREYALGNISRGLSEERQESFRSSVSRLPDECDGCAFFDRCSNYCACANRQGTGDPGRPSPFLCEHERMLIPIADRAGAVLWRERNALFIEKTYNEAYPLLSYMDDVMKNRRGRPPS